MSGWLFLAIAAFIGAGVFLNGLRFARMTVSPWAGKRLFGQSLEGANLPIERVRLIGRIQMVAAPLFLIFFAALCFGLLGPVEGIQTIKLN